MLAFKEYITEAVVPMGRSELDPMMAERMIAKAFGIDLVDVQINWGDNLIELPGISKWQEVKPGFESLTVRGFASILTAFARTMPDSLKLPQILQKVKEAKIIGVRMYGGKEVANTFKQLDDRLGRPATQKDIKKGSATEQLIKDEALDSLIKDLKHATDKLPSKVKDHDRYPSARHMKSALESLIMKGNVHFTIHKRGSRYDIIIDTGLQFMRGFSYGDEEEWLLGFIKNLIGEVYKL